LDDIAEEFELDDIGNRPAAAGWNNGSDRHASSNSLLALQQWTSISEKRYSKWLLSLSKWLKFSQQTCICLSQIRGIVL
jgi:hypothetical protein